MSEQPYEVLRTVLSMKDSWSGWAAEFGVFTGTSLGVIAEHMPVIGFDSFEGLPEDWRPEFPKGSFDIIGNPEGPGIEDVLLMGANRMIVPGWFKDTVPNFPFPSLDLVHIDRDLYSSTATVLHGVTPYVHPGTVVVFDEFHGYLGSEQHERKAWEEFVEANHVVAEVLAAGAEACAFLIRYINNGGLR